MINDGRLTVHFMLREKNNKDLVMLILTALQLVNKLNCPVDICKDTKQLTSVRPLMYTGYY